MRRTGLLMLLMLCGALGAAELRLPAGFVPQETPERGSWRQWGELPLAYAAARSQVDLALRKQGWRKAKTVEFDRVQWKLDVKAVLHEALQTLRGIPQVPGGYITGRYLNNAFLSVITNYENAADTLYESVELINEEIMAKRKEFGLPAGQ